MAGIQTLRCVLLFESVPDEELAPLAACMIRRSYAKDALIFSEGAPGNALYIIEAGHVRIFLTSSSGQHISLNVYGPGQVFGEISLLDGLPRSASAGAVDQVAVLVLDRADFLQYMDAHPVVARNLVTLLAMRLRYTTTYAESLAFLDVPGRVAARLLQQDAWHGQPGTGQMTVSQSELATWVAASREERQQDPQ